MKKALIFGAAALGAAAMGRRGQRSRKIFLAMQGLPNRHEATPKGVKGSNNPVEFDAASVGKRWVLAKYPGLRDREVVAVDTGWRQWQYAGRGNAYLLELPSGKKVWNTGITGKYFVLREAGSRSKGRRAARPRTYKTLAGLSRAMGDRTLSLDEIHSQRAYLKGKGWSPIKYKLTYADATDIADALGGQYKTRLAVRNGLLGGRIGDLPYSTRQRIVWDKTYPLKNGGWHYVAGQDWRAETARIRKILKK